MTKIPMPEGYSRIESGALKFGNDWAGVFIRGDTAGWMAFRLKQAMEAMERGDMEVAKELLCGLMGCGNELYSTLSSCIEGPAKEMFVK